MGCIYCTYGSSELQDNHNHSQERAISAPELLQNIKNLHDVLHLQTIRFTGGEPLLYQELPWLVEKVREIGIPSLKITTNGLLLEKQARQLAQAGISEVNISLDALDEDVFYAMGQRRGVNRVLSGINAALAAGLKIKLNSVIMRGINESQILPLLTYAASKNIGIRFLEIMAMGHLHGHSQDVYFSQEEILAHIAGHHSIKKLPRTPSSTANYWQTDEGYTFGIVANESEPFCGDCDRLRLDSYGNIYGCLSSNRGISIRNTEKKMLSERLNEALSDKQVAKFAGSKLSMLHIGG